jgi:Xaa-Pro aminopeptidase
MADGVEVSAVRAASRARVRELGARLQGDAVREALDADSSWHLHGVGVDSGEEGLSVLRAGSVIAYEPGLRIGSDAFYLEDMILITPTGHEVLSSGLPYDADEIAAMMRR